MTTERRQEEEKGNPENTMAANEQDIGTEGIETEEKRSEENDKKVTTEENVVLNNVLHSVENHKGNINIYVQYQKEYLTNNGLMIGDGAEFHNFNYGTNGEGSSSNVNPNDMIEDSELLGQWIIDHFHSVKLSYMISCCVFHSMPYFWISEAADLLFTILEKDENGTQRELFSKHNIKEFGAEIYTDEINSNVGKTPMDYVRFIKDSYPEIILKYVWNSFPQLRTDITDWLKNFMLFGKNTMFRRAITTVGILAQEDFYYFSHDIVISFYQEKKILMDMALAQIMLLLNENVLYQKNFDPMLKNWSSGHEIHRLLTAMLICLQKQEKITFLENAIRNYLRGVYESVLKDEENEFINCIIDFFCIGMRNFSFYRIMIECLYEFAEATKLKRELKLMCAGLFLAFVSIDTIYSCFDEEEKNEAIFIKLTYCKNSVRIQLCKLWQMVWSIHEYRMDFYSCLGVYFVQINETERKKKIKQFVIAAFSDVCSDEYLESIIRKIEKKCRRIERNE